MGHLWSIHGIATTPAASHNLIIKKHRNGILIISQKAHSWFLSRMYWAKFISYPSMLLSIRTTHSSVSELSTPVRHNLFQTIHQNSLANWRDDFLIFVFPSTQGESNPCSAIYWATHLDKSYLYSRLFIFILFLQFLFSSQSLQ